MIATLPPLPGDTEHSRPPGPDVAPSLIDLMAAAVGAREVDGIEFCTVPEGRRCFVHLPGELGMRLLALPEPDERRAFDVLAAQAVRP